MVVLGLILIALVAGTAVDAYFQNDRSEQVVLFGAHISNASPGRVFLAGMVAMLVLVLGAALARRGLARSHRRRVAHRTALAERDDAASSAAAAAASAAAERDRLAAELAREREVHTETGTETGTEAAVGDRPSPAPSRLRGESDDSVVLPEAVGSRSASGRHSRR